MGSLKLDHRRPHGGSYADKGGRGGRRKAEARPATPVRLRSWRRRNPLTEPMLTLVGPSQGGGGVCRPVSAPARVSQARKGRRCQLATGQKALQRIGSALKISPVWLLTYAKPQGSVVSLIMNQ